MSRKLLNRFRCSNPSSGPKSQILRRAKLARFLGRALLAAAEPRARRGPAAGLVARWSRVRLWSGWSRARFLPGARFALCRRVLRIQARAAIARAKLARILGQALVPARGPRARRGPGRASAGGPGLVCSCAHVFFVAPLLFRAAATFFVAAPWFSTSGNQEGAAAFRHHYAWSAL